MENIRYLKDVLFGFERINLSYDPVTIEKWSHPVPSRTRKLSTSSASIAEM